MQPVLIEADREVEEAAASLGASSWTTFRRVVLPTLAPAVISGTGLAFARAIGEYGSVVLIGGNIPRETQVASQYIQQQIEIDRPVNAAAVSVALLAIAFVDPLRAAAAVGPHASVARRRRREDLDAGAARACAPSPWPTSACSLAVPIVLILWRTFGDGVGAFVDSVRTPAAISALNLSLLIVAIVVPLNVVFGVATALALVRGRFPRPRGSSRRSSTCRSPCRRSSSASRSSCCGGPAAGSGGWRALGFRVIFGLPGMVIATIFVTLPFVVREVEPVLHEIGTEQEQAAATLGACGWQTFWRITLPGHPLGADLRRRAHRRAGAGRVRRGDHGQLGLPRGLADAHPARPLAATSTTTTPTARTAAATLLMGLAVVDARCS